MIFINPQWQATGYTDETRMGARTSKNYFSHLDLIEIPLSNADLTLIDDIKCLKPIIEQTLSFKSIIQHALPDKISTMGGDCAVDLMPISYLNKKYGSDMCIVWIDSHADIHTPESSPSKNFHGMPLRVLLGEGHPQVTDLLFSTISTDQICYIGLRDVDKAEKEYIDRHNITSLPDCDYLAVQRKLDHFGQVYIHLDLDVLDQSEYRYTKFPSDHGLLIHDVADLISQIKSNHRVVGLCITESIATDIDQLIPLRPILDQIEV